MLHRHLRFTTENKPKNPFQFIIRHQSLKISKAFLDSLYFVDIIRCSQWSSCPSSQIEKSRLTIRGLGNNSLLGRIPGDIGLDGPSLR